ncbi:enoyl-CoA hydratase-related protein [Bosea sp. (in: a-proteobacteria)]|uniref:enoyl-CoA hydratase-related protein n=1 Tax=Bosea sp. (in: a-proteobacteria) TaxID=1871050 RepID=UPI002626DE88|nr:enoyl-CoA hydratase-related protein [Bosea sp. (in: a-proteobacteria)]MCO5090913.1 enoyl-CoA hydratase-related protein [Bosea sp. (in: a-proteobacteria)]
MSGGFETIDFSVSAGIARVTLDRPGVLNALSGQMIAELLEAVKRIEDDPAARVMVLTGAGRGFCSGMDLGDPLTGLGLDRAQRSAVTRERMDRELNALVRAIAKLPKPKIAAVNGVVAGGGVGMALATDMVVAAQSASFIQVFTPKLGLIPDSGCTWFLPRLVGRARAVGLALLGDKLPATTAAEWGLIWKAVPDDALAAEVDAIAARLAGGPANAQAATVAAIDLGSRRSLDEQLDHERDVNGELNAAEEFEEGVRAFIEKRAPRFA